MQLNHAIDRFLVGYFSTRDLSEKTLAAYTGDLRQFAAAVGGRKQLRSLDADTIEGYAATLKEEGYAPASLQRKMVSLRVFFQYWVRRGELEVSPFWGLRLSFGPPRTLPRTLTESEVGRLLRWVREEPEPMAEGGPAEPGRVDRSFLALRNRALVDLLLATGIRVGEAAGLTVEDVCLAEGSLRVRGKGRRPRLAYVVPSPSLALQRHHLQCRLTLSSETRALFLNVFGTALTTQGMANALAQVGRQAGIERHITPHMIRHTVATHLLRNGADLRVVQEFLGHASITSTQRYTHVTGDHLVHVLRARHPFL